MQISPLSLTNWRRMRPVGFSRISRCFFCTNVYRCRLNGGIATIIYRLPLNLQVYRHEGAKGKSELRCHAAFCRKETEAKSLEARLKATLANTLREYYKEQKRKEKGSAYRAQRVYHGS